MQPTITGTISSAELKELVDHLKDGEIITLSIDLPEDVWEDGYAKKN